ncbi:MAG TPA: hypothetical protein PLK67_05635, partial [Bryobacteraceae bacterium]|nr:hypothetical protein [Bryobacteraceae bacterium]
VLRKAFEIMTAEAETCAPDFAHYPDLPCWQDNGVRLTLLAGTYDGRTAPTRGSLSASRMTGRARRGGLQTAAP